MFDFDNDDIFNLNDMIEIDIKYGIFDDNKINVSVKKDNIDNRIYKETDNIHDNIHKCYARIEKVLNDTSYNERDLFKAFCQLADVHEKQFEILTQKFMYIYENITQYIKEDRDVCNIENKIEELIDIYEEMEECISVFEEVLNFGYEEIDEYYDRKLILEDELFELEILKDEVEKLTY